MVIGVASALCWATFGADAKGLSSTLSYPCFANLYVIKHELGMLLFLFFSPFLLKLKKLTLT
jgi:hypothetical protein